jgi:hypothetical protein
VYEVFGRIDFVDQPLLQMFSPMLSGVMSGFVSPGTSCGFGTTILRAASCPNAGTKNQSSAALTDTSKRAIVDKSKPSRQN